MSDVLLVRRDLDFLLHDWLRLDTLLARPRFAEHTRETVDAVLDLAEKLAAEVFLPHYKDSDRQEPWMDADGVHVLPAIRAAIAQYAELGLFGAGFPEALGGMGLPNLVCSAAFGQFTAASVGAAAYIMLAVANARLIATFGTQAQIDAFARPQIAGRWLGTMCLSEPQAGSSLADIRTRAEPDGEDALGRRFRLTGNKMWISGGDHDITDNIVHLVLAKVPGPDGRLVEGTRGISLFIVPKRLPDGARNDVVVAGLNHKMGYRGTVNTLLNFGEGNHRPDGAAGAVGWLVGEVGQGLPQMFQMMNEARISIGLGGAVLGYRGYRHALAYAKERIQGRPLQAGKGGTQPVALIEHPDVRRMLLAQKAYAEGALALVLYCARLVDEHDDAEAAELLGLLTPVAKTWPSEWGLVANDLAIQVHGGYGYTRDFDVEQLYRDNRLNPIHEGTTGIQALDLLGRKILRNRVDALGLLARRIDATRERAGRHPDLAGHAAALGAAWLKIEAAVASLRALGDEPRALQNATWFLQAFGHVVLAWLWLDQAALCAAATAPGDFEAGKRWACRFFFETELPRIDAWLAPVAAGSDVAAAAPPAIF
jgi:alkylation response protein AidB-like acyl-CoA dehydrogenase